MRSSVRLFADDRVLYGHIKSPNDCQMLLNDMNPLIITMMMIIIMILLMIKVIFSIY